MGEEGYSDEELLAGICGRCYLVVAAARSCLLEDLEDDRARGANRRMRA